MESCKLTGFTLYRGESLSNISELVVNTKEGWHNDTDLLNGRRYYYQVTANNSAGEGIRCDPVLSLPLGTPSEPLGLNARSGDGKVHLNWTRPLSTGGGEIFGYRIYRNTSDVGEFPIIKDLGNVTSWEDSDVELGVIYYYQVLTFNSRNDGLPCEPALIKATGPPSPPIGFNLTPLMGRSIWNGRCPSAQGAPHSSDTGSTGGGNPITLR
jgi:fibronectin type 3 domain-containing protein